MAVAEGFATRASPNEGARSGSQTYDGLIAIAAAASDATLVTLDTRALPAYARVGVNVHLIG